METIVVALGERSYPIHIGPDLLDEPALYGRAAKQTLLVTNDVVAPLYLARVQAALRGRELETVVVPDGERHKTLATFTTVIDRLIDARFHRDCCLVALGGGGVSVSGWSQAGNAARQNATQIRWRMRASPSNGSRSVARCVLH